MSLSSEQRTAAETDALRELSAFPLLEALYGRRSRRFALGDEIRTARSPTSRGTNRSHSPSWSGCSS